MKQNKYDGPIFFAKYSAMPRSIGSLDEAGEWAAFRGLLPDLHDKRVLDLGCGFGWHCRYAAQNGARTVVGIDLSERMLARATETTIEPAVCYIRQAIEEISFGPGQFDIVVSSLALHYVEGLDAAFRRVGNCLVDGGSFAISVEHPIFTALGEQGWCLSEDGRRRHWPVDNYLQEGIRATDWMSENVTKYHRTVATYVNSLIDAGFRIERLLEPAPPPQLLNRHPEWKDEVRRPMFLLIAATRA